MADSDFTSGVVVGVLVALPAGVCLGWLIAQLFMKPSPSSVLFDRDEKGHVTGIHYVPLGEAKT